jgi:hypothetical protein
MGGLSQDRQTDTNGNSCLPALPEGLYSVEASLQGFLNVRYYPVRVSYPQKNALTLKLPIGDISGGGLGSGISLSGTLLKMEKPAQAAEICLLKLAGGRLACTTTNDLGEYALLVPPGIYNVNLKLSSGTSYRYRIDVSATGALYRNLLFIPKQSRKGAN